MIGKKFNLDAGAVVPMIMVRANDQAAKDEFEGHMQMVTEKMGTFIKEHIDGQHLLERLNNMQSIEQIEKMDVNLIPKIVYSIGIDYVNSQPKLNDSERMMILVESLNQTILAVQEWWRTQALERSQRIANQGAKLIGLNGKPVGKGKKIIHNDN